MRPYSSLLTCWILIDSRGRAALILSCVFTIEPIRLHRIVPNPWPQRLPWNLLETKTEQHIFKNGSCREEKDR